jgi:hypothetical protein
MVFLFIFFLFCSAAILYFAGVLVNVLRSLYYSKIRTEKESNSPISELGFEPEYHDSKMFASEIMWHRLKCRFSMSSCALVEINNVVLLSQYRSFFLIRIVGGGTESTRHVGQ